MTDWCTKMFDRMTGWTLGPSGHLPVWSLLSQSACDMLLKWKKKQVYLSEKWNSNDTGCRDLCSLSAWPRSSRPRKTKVSYIKTALDITQNNNTAVRSETCSHWPSNIQKQNLTDARTDAAVVTYQDKQDHTMSSRLSIVKVLLRWTVNEVSDTKAGPRSISAHQENVQRVPRIPGLDDINNSGGVFTDSAISNIKRFQEKFTYESMQGGRAASGLLPEQILLNKQGEPGPDMDERAVSTQRKWKSCWGVWEEKRLSFI